MSKRKGVSVVFVDSSMNILNDLKKKNHTKTTKPDTTNPKQ